MSAGPATIDRSDQHEGASPLEEVSGENYVPYVKPEENVREFTLQVLILGLCQAVFFGLADGYLGLKIGLTVSASIPAAVISMAVLRGILKRGTVLENNLVQNMASVGESLAAGAVFTIPALYLLQDYLVKTGEPLTFSPSWFKSFFIACLGGMMGILFMIPLRRFLIVKEHGKLRYPEGTACAEVLMAGDEGGEQAKTVFTALGIAGLYRMLMGGFKLFPEVVAFPLGSFPSVLSFDMLPSLLAVGFIIGLRTCGIMLAGASLGWFVIIPLITYFGGHSAVAIGSQTTKLISAMDPYEVHKYYLKYIGAGAVAMGGIISLIRSLPTIVDSFGTAIRGVLKPDEASSDQHIRTFRDIPFLYVIGGLFVMFLMLGLATPVNPSGFLGAFLAVVFAFFFVTVSSRIVGIVGSTSMPLSGMTIGALLATCGILKLAGWGGSAGIAAALVIACFVCIAISMGGDISQDLKIGFLVGATPRWVQITQLIAVTISAMSVAIIVHGFAPHIIDGKFTAVQANLMFTLTKGIMEQNLPWMLVIAGAGIAVVVEMMDIGSLPFAIGLYLPLELSTTIVFGGLIHWGALSLLPARAQKAANDKGLLAASGLVAGDALVGVGLGLAQLLGGMRANMPKDWDLSWLVWPQGVSWCDKYVMPGNIVTCVVFAALCVYLWRIVMRRGREAANETLSAGVNE
jgi:putative OPT family oligopeptide transporter